MAAHDIDGIATRERAAIAVAPVDAADAPVSAKKGKKKQDKPASDDDQEADSSHPRPDHATVLWLLWNQFAVSPEVAAAALNVSRNSGYAAIYKGDIPATRVGNRLMVPTAYLRQRLYLELPSPGGKPAPQIALQPRKQEAKPRRRSR